MIQLALTKESGRSVIMPLNKCTKFVAKLFWDSKHDVDVHALALDRSGSLDDDAGRILSSYNTACVLQSDGQTPISQGTKKPFQNALGYLKHEGDRRDGMKAGEAEPDEVIVIDLEKVPADIASVAFVVSIHPPSTSTFAEVKNCRIVIEDDNGTALIDGSLTSDFDGYSVVTIGSVANEGGTWKFNPKALGYDKNPDGSPADLNTVISDNNR